MQAAIDQFRSNIVRVRNLGSIFYALDSQTTRALDLSDILRAQLVLAVSALDQFIHEVVRLGMLDAYDGNRARTQRFLRFDVSLESALMSAEGDGGPEWLDNQIRIRNGHRSFQTPDSIANAIRLISDVRLWDETSLRQGTSSQELRNRLRIIVDRRNQIAHEADMNRLLYGELSPIDSTMTTDTVDFIENLAETIYEVLVQSA